MRQATALAILQQGKNVFLTGHAGSGKTHVLNQYIHWLRVHGIVPAITASTGIAATHINGTTIHSWSGMGIAQALTDDLRVQCRDAKNLGQRIRRTSVLIIDEISMISPQFLDGVDRICRDARSQQSQAFGGMQVVFSGDFFQLPPITSQEIHSEKHAQQRYAWQSQAWLDAQITPCYITEQHRQVQGDPLLRLLTVMRSGEVTEGDLEDLRERFGITVDDGVEPTRLYTHNADVDRINQQALEEIEAESFYYNMETQGRAQDITALQRGCLAPETLELCEGARVMFVKNNYEKGYINGSLGTVVGFDHETGYPRVLLYTGETILATPEEWTREKDGKKCALLRQVPLRLAWAMTVHKSQGMSLDAAEIDLSKCFEVGQGYVALSRVRRMTGLYLQGFNDVASRVDPLTVKVDRRFQELSLDAEHQQKLLTKKQQAKKSLAWIMRAGGTEEEIDYKTQKSQMRETTYEKTRKLLAQQKSLQEIAQERGIAERTVLGHILFMRLRGEKVCINHIDVDEQMLADVRKVYQELTGGDAHDDLYTDDGHIRLKPFYTLLQGRISYNEIQLALIHII